MADSERYLAVRVTTPEGVLYKGKARMVVAPGVDGDFGVLPRHTALLAALGPGVLRLVTGSLRGEETALRYAIQGGFLQVVNDEVVILVTAAIADPAQIDAAAADRDYAAAVAALRSPASDEEYEDLLAARRWAAVRKEFRAPLRSGH